MRPPRFTFKREASLLTVLYVLVPLVGILLAIVWPRIMRWLEHGQ